MSVMRYAILLAEFGERESQLIGMLKNVRAVTDLPVIIYTDRLYPRLGSCPKVSQKLLPPEQCYWQGHRRYFNRNNDYWKIKAAMMETDYNVVLVLDDDMRIVNDKFVDGFALAEKFGLCLPLNPRTYFGLDREVGDDVSPETLEDTKHIPYHMTANNMGTVFLNISNERVGGVAGRYVRYMQEYPCRGPVAMAVACWQEGLAPYFLPEEWCLCGGNAAFRYRSSKRILPMLLHVGHKDIEKWFKTDPAFTDFQG